jgi:hypothetical protein
MIDTVLSYPDEPSSADADVGTDEATLRYDDLVQDGRVRLESAWRPTGRILWSHPEVARVLRSMGKNVTNVLSRVTMQASGAALVPRSRMRTNVRFRFEHTTNGTGDVDRILFSTWLSAMGQVHGGSEALVARAYGQRVFTRLDAPAGQHLITRLDGFGPSGIPAHRAAWEPVTSLLALPPGAEPLDPAPRLEPVKAVFGLSHTDMNQHVNFLMYHREIERAALSRFIALGLGARFLSREASFGYRKPSFAGDVVRIALQAFRAGEAVGVVAALVEDDGGPPERPAFRDFGSPRNVSRMVFRS